MQLVLESEDQDTKEFYEVVGNYLLRKKQRAAIKENRF